MRGGNVEFDFRGKHGIQHHLEISDSQLARIVRKCQDLPRQDLFQYVDDDGQRHAVSSDDVNDYLREISGEEITAKDFRTWAGTNLAVVALRELAAGMDGTAVKQHIVRAIAAVAKMLGNTPAICRKCYIHPAIFEGYLSAANATSIPRSSRAISTAVC